MSKISSDISAAARALERGELVAFPTETVYGLGADAASDTAVSKIYAAKGRPATNPLIIHVADAEQAEGLIDMPPAARRLARAFWPGPLTIVAPAKEGAPVSAIARAGLPTLAVRVPSHPLAQKLLRAFGGPLAAPSANVSGRLSPTEAEHVDESPLADHVALILDGGECAVGLESTIVGFDEEGEARLLRPGGIAAEEIEKVLGAPLLRPQEASPEAGANEAERRPTAPGQLTSHYAPRAKLRLNAFHPEPGEMFLAFGPDAPHDVPGLNLSPSGDLAEAAANLYAYLHILDETGVDTIAVAPIPETGLGEAINDRLRRAAAPRPPGRGRQDEETA